MKNKRKNNFISSFIEMANVCIRWLDLNGYGCRFLFLLIFNGVDAIHDRMEHDKELLSRKARVFRATERKENKRTKHSLEKYMNYEKFFSFFSPSIQKRFYNSSLSR